jgi:uncharacterized protein YcnI
MNRSGTAAPARRRALLRPLAVAGAALAAVLVLASPAAAHTEIEIDNPTAGATNVTMSVKAEAESKTAGIASVAVQLPGGITPDQVSLASGPTGWTLTATADGYQVAGPALATGTDAAYRITIRKLPDTAGVLTFKTVVTYSNGDVDSWIGAPDADNPAPTVTVTGGTGPTAGPSATATAVATSSAPGPAFGTPGATEPTDNGGWPAWATWLIVLIVLVALAAAGGAVLVIRRRRGTPPPAA